MNRTFVADFENHSVYLVSCEFISFYINVLKRKENADISIDLKAKRKNNVRDIISCYEKIDNYNITLVIPLVDFSEDYDEFKLQSNYVSKIINWSHKFLLENDINVNSTINVIKHNSIRSDFIDFFLKQFSSRVKYISLDDLVHKEVPYNKINAANISFVIGKPELELTIKEEEMKQVIEQTKKEIEEEKVVNVKPKKSFATASGFVSYYLLGFLTAVITLLVLTNLVK